MNKICTYYNHVGPLTPSPLHPYRSWQYSGPLREVVKSYVEEFPELFEELEVHLKKDMISANDIAAKFGQDFKLVANLTYYVALFICIYYSFLFIRNQTNKNYPIPYQITDRLAVWPPDPCLNNGGAKHMKHNNAPSF